MCPSPMLSLDLLGEFYKFPSEFVLVGIAGVEPATIRLQTVHATAAPNPESALTGTVFLRTQHSVTNVRRIIRLCRAIFSTEPNETSV
jgi:hypothetical protein